MNKQKVKFLKWQLSAAFTLLAIILATGIFIFTPLSWQQVARALTGNYSKNTGDQLTVNDWNNLDDDFLDKSGDTMSGDLNMDSHNISNVGAVSANSISANSVSVNGDLDMNSHNINNVSSLSGHTVNGDLNMSNNHITNLAAPVNDNDAATKEYVDNNTGNTIEILNSGSAVGAHIVCGQTTPGTTAWHQYDNTDPTHNSTVYTDVVIPSGIFSHTPIYVISLGGAGNHYRTYGSNSVYNPTPTGFRVYVTRLSQDSEPGTSVRLNSISANDAQTTFQWHINWCGIEIK